MSRFKDKVVIVTAAASGIGLAIAKRFASEGASLSLSDIDEPALRKQVAKMALPTERMLASRTDVTEMAQMDTLIAATVEHFGRIDVLVNNAGIGCFGYLTDIEVDRWKRVFATDVDSIFYSVRFALPHLIRSGGCIVNTASISGLYGDYGFAGYNAAKGAVVNLTRNLAIDHAQDGVRVNAICPGLTETPATAWMRASDDVMEAYADRLPMGRAGKPEEMAAGVAFLASADASYITGHCLVIDGGLTAATGQPNFKRLLPKR